MRLPIKTGPLFIGLAVLMGIFAIVLISSSGSGKKKVVKKPKQTVEAKVLTSEVVVPMKTILKGEMLTPDALKVVKWPKDFLPTGSTFDAVAGLVGRVAIQDMYPGEPVYEQKLSSVDSAGLPALIPNGYRAITIKVSEVKGVAGFIKPGDKVDVLGTFTVSKMMGEKQVSVRKTVTVLQDVLVLASAQSMVNERKLQVETPEGVLKGKARTDADVKAKEEAEAAENEDDKKSKKKKARKKNKKEKVDAKAEAKKRKEEAKKKKDEAKAKLESQKRAKLTSSVTLGVTPEQAEIVTVAEESASLRLVLRGSSDKAYRSLPGVEEESVFGQKVTGMSPPTPSTPSSNDMSMTVRGNVVELIQGTEKTDVSF